MVVSLCRVLSEDGYSIISCFKSNSRDFSGVSVISSTLLLISFVLFADVNFRTKSGQKI